MNSSTVVPSSDAATRASSPTDGDDSPSVDDLRQMGNHHFTKAEYDAALTLYSAAIDKADATKNVEAMIVNLCNRSACFFQMEEYEQAQLDAHQAIKVSSNKGSPSVVKAYYRLAKTQIALKSFENAMETIEEALESLEGATSGGATKGQMKALKDLLTEANKKAGDQQQQQQQQSGKDGNDEETTVKTAARNLSIREFIRGKDLGVGNFSEIVVCSHKTTKERFALKIIEKKRAADLAKRQHPNVYNEIQMERRVLLERLPPHHNIVRMYHAFQDYNSLYYLMDLYIDGPGDLWSNNRWRKLMVGCHRSQTKVWLAEILDAMEHMHTHGIVHRDLKTENVLLSPSGHVVVIDFGTAKDLLEQDLNGPEFVGTPDFMSPEAVSGSSGPEAMEKDREEGKKGADHTADLWALGAVAFQMHTGQTPFSCPSQYLSFLKIKRGNVQRPWGIADDAAWDLIRSLMQLEPKDRLGADAFEWNHGNLKSTMIKKSGGYDMIRRHPYFAERSEFGDLPLPSNYKKVTPIPSLRDLCTRACVDLVQEDANDLTLCDQHPPGDGSSHDFMRLDQRDRFAVMHLLDRLHLLAEPTIYRRFFTSTVEYRLNKIREGPRDYVGLTRMTDNQGQFPAPEDPYAPESTKPDPIPVVQITNPLFIKQINTSCDSDTRKQFTKLLKKCIASINRCRPKCVMVCGYIDEPCRKLLSRINDSIPVVIVDGSTYYSVWHSGAQFLALSSRLPLDSGSEQMAWIREEVEQVRMAKYHLFVLVDNDPRALSDRVLKTLTRGRAHLISGLCLNTGEGADRFENKIAYSANDVADDDGASIKSTDSDEDEHDEWVTLIVGSKANGLRWITLVDRDDFTTEFDEIGLS